VEKLKIISVTEPNGELTGWLANEPGVVAQGRSKLELVKNIMEAMNIYREDSEEMNKEKN
jgi:predicted RNase H-like HicB family nuclease